MLQPEQRQIDVRVPFQHTGREVDTVPADGSRSKHATRLHVRSLGFPRSARIPPTRPSSWKNAHRQNRKRSRLRARHQRQQSQTPPVGSARGTEGRRSTVRGARFLGKQMWLVVAVDMYPHRGLSPFFHRFVSDCIPSVTGRTDSRLKIPHVSLLPGTHGDAPCTLASNPLGTLHGFRSFSWVVVVGDACGRNSNATGPARTKHHRCRPAPTCRPPRFRSRLGGAGEEKPFAVRQTESQWREGVPSMQIYPHDDAPADSLELPPLRRPLRLHA
jgi:hypothetical protein